jgi:nitrile hydratase
VENLLTEAGVIETHALNERVRALGGDEEDPVAARPRTEPDQVPAASEIGAERRLDAAPRFSVGQTVRTVAVTTSGHTRLPAYARGRLGVIVALQGGWVFPDTNAHGRGENPEHLYCVRFAGEELWGREAEPGQSVHLDLFESYLEAQ